MGSIWLITGGVRSGKSRLAARLASESGLAVTYIATAEAGDDEMVARIASHRAERSPTWTTIEEPIDLAGAVRGVEVGCVLIDCLTVWASNRLYPEWPSEGLSVAESKAAQATLLEAVQETIAVLAKREGRAIVVTNEVGSGIIPGDARLRAYQDALGAVNAAMAEASERVYLCVAGLSLELKGLGGGR